METPIRQIAENAGVEGSIVVDKVRATQDPNYGLNAETVEYGDLLKQGVVDPTKVVRTALQNAASIASLLLTAEVLITDLPEKKNAAPMGGGMPNPSEMY